MYVCSGFYKSVFLVSALVCERICTKMHSIESRFIMGPNKYSYCGHVSGSYKPRKSKDCGSSVVNVPSRTEQKADHTNPESLKTAIVMWLMFPAEQNRRYMAIYWHVYIILV